MTSFILHRSSLSNSAKEKGTRAPVPTADASPRIVTPTANTRNALDVTESATCLPSPEIARGSLFTPPGWISSPSEYERLPPSAQSHEEFPDLPGMFPFDRTYYTDLIYVLLR